MNVIDSIIQREGGFTIDHAGPTNFGITIPAYSEFIGRKATRGDIEYMRREDAVSFYSWKINKLGISGIGDDLLKNLLFDCIINHGDSRAIKWAQAAAGVKTDGILGPITIEALNGDPRAIFKEMLITRVSFYAEIVANNPSKYLKYLRGWIDYRVCNFIGEL